jgi:hypothetical protein
VPAVKLDPETVEPARRWKPGIQVGAGTLVALPCRGTPSIWDCREDGNVDIVAEAAAAGGVDTGPATPGGNRRHFPVDGDSRLNRGQITDTNRRATFKIIVAASVFSADHERPPATEVIVQRGVLDPGRLASLPTSFGADARRAPGHGRRALQQRVKKQQPLPHIASPPSRRGAQRHLGGFLAIRHERARLACNDSAPRRRRHCANRWVRNAKHEKGARELQCPNSPCGRARSQAQNITEDQSVR